MLSVIQKMFSETLLIFWSRRLACSTLGGRRKHTGPSLTLTFFLHVCITFHPLGLLMVPHILTQLKEIQAGAAPGFSSNLVGLGLGWGWVGLGGVGVGLFDLGP